MGEPVSSLASTNSRTFTSPGELHRSNLRRGKAKTFLRRNWIKHLPVPGLVLKFCALNKQMTYFISSLYTFLFNSQKLISYIIRINASSTNTFVNVNSINGHPKSFLSAGMFNFQKKQKIKQPK